MDNSNSAIDVTIVSLASRIVEGKTTYAGVKRELDEIEEAFDNPFAPYSLERRVKPWDMAYLKQLRAAVPFGAFSKEYLLHMSEVADDVYRKKRIIRQTILSVTATLAFILVVLSFMRRFKR